MTWRTIANERYVFSWLTSVGEHSYFYGTWGSRVLRFSLGAVSFHWLPWWLSGRESTCNAEDAGLIPGSGRSPGRGHGNHSSILAWRIPWTEEPDGLQPTGLQRVRHDGKNSTHTHTSSCTASYNTRGRCVLGRKRPERDPCQRSRHRTSKGKERQLLTFSC